MTPRAVGPSPEASAHTTSGATIGPCESRSTASTGTCFDLRPPRKSAVPQQTEERSARATAAMGRSTLGAEYGPAMPEGVARFSQAAQEVPLRCPACTAPLPDPRACAACGREYARVAGVPLLVPDREPAAVDLRAKGGGLPAHDAAALSVPAVREA